MTTDFMKVVKIDMEDILAGLNIDQEEDVKKQKIMATLFR